MWEFAGDHAVWFLVYLLLTLLTLAVVAGIVAGAIQQVVKTKYAALVRMARVGYENSADSDEEDEDDSPVPSIH